MPYKYEERQRRWQRRRYQYRQRIISRYKIMRGCDNCGYHRMPHVLEFHHLRDKKRPITQMMLYGWATIKREIAKCELLCANCHREKTRYKRV